MKPRRRNVGCVYTGRVGAKMSVPLPRPNRRRYKRLVRFTGGPLHNRRTHLDNDADLTTFVFTCKGQTGRYVRGEWQTS